MDEEQPKRTEPRKKEIDPVKDKHLLFVGRYGTKEMGAVWGAERTFEYALLAQAEAVQTLAQLGPEIVPKEHADEISAAANLQRISPDRIRELEEKTGHDVIAINKALEEVVSREAAAHINKGRTSADTTETAKALQIKKSIEIILEFLFPPVYSEAVTGGVAMSGSYFIV
jgi:adenylosuccinate lyase